MSTYNSFSRSNSIHEEWKIVDKFDSAYWSGLDVHVYANNILLSEAIQVSYMISEQIRPYYGYASYSADKIHHGSRIIQGEVSLNFKKDGYLFSLLHSIRTQDPRNVWLRQNNETLAVPDRAVPIEYKNTPYGPTLWEQLKTEGISRTTANDMVEKYKASQLGSLGSTPIIQQSAGLFETTPNGFDLNIIFGANLNAEQSLRWIDGEDYSLDSSTGQYAEGRVVEDPTGGSIAYTGLKIVDVHIGGLARTIGDDGRPIIETYTFLAKDIVILKNVDSFNAVDKNVAVIKSPVTRKNSTTLDSNTGKIGASKPPAPFPIN